MAHTETFRSFLTKMEFDVIFWYCFIVLDLAGVRYCSRLFVAVVFYHFLRNVMVDARRIGWIFIYSNSVFCVVLYRKSDRDKHLAYRIFPKCLCVREYAYKMFLSPEENRNQNRTWFCLFVVWKWVSVVWRQYERAHTKQAHTMLMIPTIRFYAEIQVRKHCLCVVIIWGFKIESESFPFLAENPAAC